MRAYVRTLPLVAIAALVAIAPATAAAAPSKRAKAAKPKITRVTPMRVELGQTLTIRGRNFKPQKRRNTIIFKGAAGRTAFAKPQRASRRKLVVKIPASVARLLLVEAGKQRPTRLQLRVLAGRFSAFTTRRLSPVVLGLAAGEGPGGGGGQPLAVCNKDGDHDDDLLPNQLEIDHGTDPCLLDTDRDGSSDGWEYYSAKDLNFKAVPYPASRPYPNPLDPSDAGIDFDGDGLRSHEEFRAWRFTGSAFDGAKAETLDLESPLGYSDGTQFSRAGDRPGVPKWQGPRYGLPAPTAAFEAILDHHGDAPWGDDERDADADGLANWLEADRGPRNSEWWGSFWAQEEYGIEPWPERVEICGQAPGMFSERPFAALDLADPDIDGDTLLDGEDDQDTDDFSNIVETYETLFDLDGNGQAACGFAIIPSIIFNGEQRVVNAFNPCAPNPDSRTCSQYEPF